MGLGMSNRSTSLDGGFFSSLLFSNARKRRDESRYIIVGARAMITQPTIQNTLTGGAGESY